MKLALSLRNITHRFGPEVVLQNIHLDVPIGQLVALLGRSGCGKTTLLRIAAGLLVPTEGQVLADFRRNAMVFQQPSLLPWKRLLDNIALGLKAQGLSRAEQHARAAQLALQVGLRGEDNTKFPTELSGGMQSRAALARALAIEPAMLLLDEPFSALDIGLRSEMHALLAEQISQHSVSALLVTHDLMDAVRLAHELVLLIPQPGRILTRFRIDRSIAARDEPWVYRSAALLLRHPLLRQAFEFVNAGTPADEDELACAGITVFTQPPEIDTLTTAHGDSCA